MTAMMRRDPEGIEIQTLNHMVDLAGARLLEIGAGDGRMIWQYAASAAQVFGVDTSREQTAQALRDRPQSLAHKVHLVEAQGEALPFVDKAFDGAIFAWSF